MPSLSRLGGQHDESLLVDILEYSIHFSCDILEHLLRDGEIETVFAFNRRGTSAMERQRSRFRERGHDVGLLDLPKFRMVEVDLKIADLGIERELLEEIRTSVTHIMHNGEGRA